MSTAEIIVCIALLFCTLVSSSNTKQSWEHFDFAEVNADKERLRNGNNLIYISFGSKPFLESTVVNIKTRFCTDQVTVIDVNKVDLSSKHIQSSTILFLENFAKISRNATIAQGLQRANALFSLHDSTTTIARSLVVILFEIETIDSDSWNTLRNKSWKKFVSEYFESSDAQINGRALAGRINRAFIEEPAQDNKTNLDVGSTKSDSISRSAFCGTNILNLIMNAFDETIMIKEEDLITLDL